jgi:Na+/proline symporter|tara:strand:+ start:599 stop:988 length:390 start_codon:yes stop_codon:yes gene_type:complete
MIGRREKKMADEVQKKGNPLGLTSMILGIVSVVLVFIPCMGWLAFIPGVLAVIFGAISLKKVNAGEADNKGMSIAGLVCGLIAVVINIVVITIFAKAVSEVGKAIGEYDEEVDNAIEELDDAIRELDNY